MKTNRAVIVQCRLSSTRLPGKALLDLGGKPVLGWVLSAMHKVKADRYFVATDEASYSQIKPVCDQYDFECFAGSLEDVLKRFCDLISQINVKTVVRATADNPFLFYEAAVDSLEEFESKNKTKAKCDYLTYSGLPHGSGVEIFSADSLLKAAKETTSAYDHEHVGPALYNHTDKYVCDFVKAPKRYNHPELRTTIDTYSDYLRALSVVEYFKQNVPDFSADFVPQTETVLEAIQSSFVKVPVVLMPSVKKGHGTGHLRRCLKAASGNGFFVYIPENKTLEETDSLIEEYCRNGLNKTQIISELPDASYNPIVVTDAFELTSEELSLIKNRQSVISIDEGSDYSSYCDYLLDVIPSFNLPRKPNLFDSSLIEKPENVRKEKTAVQNISKVLICLGGEDPSGFTVPAISAVKKCLQNPQIMAVCSEGGENFGPEFSDVNFVTNIPQLKEKLCEYDLVITHYGLTAFESVYAGCAVILLPTTLLHKNLAEKYNFAYIKDSVSKNSVNNALASKNIYPELQISSENNSLGDFLKELSSSQKLDCPVCGRTPEKPDQIVSRNLTRTYRRCRSCGIVYMSFTTIKDKQYKKAYFFEDYKKQYGKTYQEDFESIKKQCLKRLETIKSISGNGKEKNVLDIGCAYGPFLSAAADYHYNPFGTDISDDAVSYVQNELHYPATVSVFPALNTVEEFGIHQFDIVTMWYVIEHFKDLDSVLRKVSTITKEGGIFAFSTPSAEGISAISDKDHFYEISPSDHFSVWEPSKADSILRKYGFEVVKTISTGHHPERFPSIKKSGAKPGSLQWNWTEQLSRTKKLGDTVEIYCKKIK